MPVLARRRDVPEGPGRWCYLYRAIDHNGDLVDTMLSEHRDMAAAKAFPLRQVGHQHDA